MSDCSPLRLTENGNSSSPIQSSGGSQDSKMMQEVEHVAGQKHQKRLLKKRSNADDASGSGFVPRRTHHRTREQQPSDDHRSMDQADQTRSLSDTPSTNSGHLRYGAKNVIELFIPVSLSMLMVVGTMKAIDSYKYSSQTAIWHVMFTDQSVDTGTRVWQSFANALIMLVLIVIMTTVLILLYKFRCYKIIHGWLILSSLMLLFMFALLYIAEVLKAYNIPLDIYTLMIIIWNFGVVGMICIHWKGPLLLQQGYLIVTSALLALVFIRSLPDWTTWTVLGIVSIWDLVAVLCPRGPLRILVETAQERGEALFPALIYSSTMIWEVVTTVIATNIVTMADSNARPSSSRSSSNRRPNRVGRTQESVSENSPNRQSSKRSDMTSSNRSQHPVEIHYEGAAQPPAVDIIQPTLSDTSVEWNEPTSNINSNYDLESRRANTRDRTQRILRDSMPVDTTVTFRPENEQIEHIQVIDDERGVKLGLGDFIFYSLLVGKASSYGDWVITLSCCVAILVGLCLTLSLLAVFRKALPALPISIAFGLCSFFMSYMFSRPFAERLAINQVFV